MGYDDGGVVMSDDVTHATTMYATTLYAWKQSACNNSTENNYTHNGTMVHNSM